VGVGWGFFGVFVGCGGFWCLGLGGGLLGCVCFVVGGWGWFGGGVCVRLGWGWSGCWGFFGFLVCLVGVGVWVGCWGLFVGVWLYCGVLVFFYVGFGWMVDGWVVWVCVFDWLDGGWELGVLFEFGLVWGGWGLC